MCHRCHRPAAVDPHWRLVHHRPAAVRRQQASQPGAGKCCCGSRQQHQSSSQHKQWRCRHHHWRWAPTAPDQACVAAAAFKVHLAAPATCAARQAAAPACQKAAFGPCALLPGSPAACGWIPAAVHRQQRLAGRQLHIYPQQLQLPRSPAARPGQRPAPPVQHAGCRQPPCRRGSRRHNAVAGQQRCGRAVQCNRRRQHPGQPRIHVQPGAPPQRPAGGVKHQRPRPAGAAVDVPRAQ
jgi:hypothetical protein